MVIPVAMVTVGVARARVTWAVGGGKTVTVGSLKDTHTYAQNHERNMWYLCVYVLIETEDG